MACRPSAAATLRLMHRAVVRLLAPYLPFLTEEVWHWCYSGDAGMQASVHRSPWPTAAELETIPAPKSPVLWEAVVQALEAVRKAKAEANLSMKAPAALVTITGAPETLAAIQSAAGDIVEMLQITELVTVEGAVASGLVAVDVRL